ncbi:hypothetical protein LCGC14_2137230, partial [marine sediment metagenome]
ESYTDTTTVKNAIQVKLVDDLTELFTSVAAISAGSGVIVSADDTSPGVLEDKLLAGGGIGFVTNNPASNETRTIAIDPASEAEALAGTEASKPITPSTLLYVFGQMSQIAGLVLSNDADTEHDINITAGKATDGADTHLIVLASEITKRIDAAWAAGDDAAGLDTGSVANDTLYAVWLIKRADTGIEDALFSLSFSSPTMPTDYDKKRLVGYVLTDGSANILNFTQQGDGREVTIWQKVRLQIATGLTSTSYAAQSLAGVLPTSMVLKYLPGALQASSTADVYISVDGTNAATIFQSVDINNAIGSANELYLISFASPIVVPTNGANTYYKISGGSMTLYLRAAIIQR